MSRAVYKTVDPDGVKTINRNMIVYALVHNHSMLAALTQKERRHHINYMLFASTDIMKAITNLFLDSTGVSLDLDIDITFCADGTKLLK